VNLPASKTLHF